MSGREVEFDFGGPPDRAAAITDGPDRLESEAEARPRRPLTLIGWSRRTWITLCVIGVLIVVVANGVHHERSSGRPSVAPTPVNIGTLPPSAQEFALDRLAYLAGSTVPLHDNVRAAGSRPNCPAFPLVSGPVQLVQAALQDAVPGFSYVDSSLTMSDDVTLCGVELRARSSTGATVVVTVSAPSGIVGQNFVGLRNHDNTQVEVVQGFNDGWQIVAGWVGASGERAPLEGLMALASSTQLRW